MSHEVENMFSVRQVPWHKLGVILKEAPETVEQAIVMAGLDWKVATSPLVTEFEGEKITTNHKAVIRTSDKKTLGVVGPDYHVVQNSDAFGFFNPALEKGLVTIETAGSLMGGRRVWMLAKVAGTQADVVSGDEVNGYFLLSNSHDGSLTVRAGFTGVRVVCCNTLTQAHDTSSLLRIRHTKNAVVALDKLQEIVDFHRQKFVATVDQMRGLARVGVREDTLRKYVERVFTPEVKKRTVGDEDLQKALGKIHDKIVPLFETGRGNDLPGVKGTMWGAYNAISEYLTWERGRSVDTRLNSLWFGEAANMNSRAFTEATKLAA